MPLSEHEQRLLEQIERALYAEDPKFASTVRGGRLRKPTRRRRSKASPCSSSAWCCSSSASPSPQLWLASSFPVISVLGFLVMLGGAVLAVTSVGPAASTRRPRTPSRTRTASPAAWRSASAAASSRSSVGPHAAAPTRASGQVRGRRRRCPVTIPEPSACRRGGATERGKQPPRTESGLPAAMPARTGGPAPSSSLRAAGAVRRTSSPPPPRPRAAAPAAPRRRAGARAPAGGPRRARCRSAGRAPHGPWTRPAAPPSLLRQRPGRPRPPRRAGAAVRVPAARPGPATPASTSTTSTGQSTRPPFRSAPPRGGRAGRPGSRARGRRLRRLVAPRSGSSAGPRRPRPARARPRASSTYGGVIARPSASGVGSKIIQPMPGNQASTQACASAVPIDR